MAQFRDFLDQLPQAQGQFNLNPQVGNPFYDLTYTQPAGAGHLNRRIEGLTQAELIQLRDLLIQVFPLK